MWASKSKYKTNYQRCIHLPMGEEHFAVHQSWMTEGVNTGRVVWSYLNAQALSNHAITTDHRTEHGETLCTTVKEWNTVVQ